MPLTLDDFLGHYCDTNLNDNLEYALTQIRHYDLNDENVKFL